MGKRREFGSVRRLPSGKWQVRYRQDGRSWSGGVFDTKAQATGELANVRVKVDRRTWRSPDADDLTLAAFAQGWLESRDLRDRTRGHYARLLDRFIIPALGNLPLGKITPTVVRRWHSSLADQTGPTMRAHAYSLLRTVLATAVAEEAIAANPCRVRGAGSVKRARTIEPATVGQIVAIAGAMPKQYRMLVLVSAWCGLRFGEATELRCSDVDLDAGRLKVQRAVVRTGSGFVVGPPKSEAGRRAVAIPPHLLPALAEHLAEHAEPGPQGLVFPARTGGHLAQSSLSWHFNPAREAAGRSDLRWHDLRHTAAVLAAVSGATLAELMLRLGHSTPSAAMRYQHVAQDRDAAIAAALSEAATGLMLPLRALQGA